MFLSGELDAILQMSLDLEFDQRQRAQRGKPYMV